MTLSNMPCPFLCQFDFLLQIRTGEAWHRMPPRVLGQVKVIIQYFSPPLGANLLACDHNHRHPSLLSVVHSRSLRACAEKRANGSLPQKPWNACNKLSGSKE